MRTLAENFARGADGISQAFDASYAAAPERVSFHDESVELNFPVTIQEAASPGIEGLIVFHYDDGLFDSVERSSTLAERLPAGGDRVANAIQMSLDHVVGNCPGTAVNHENWIGWHFNLAGKMTG
jgi:hypothetical protein